MCTPVQRCAIKAMMLLPYSISDKMFADEIDRLKKIEVLALENFCFYRQFKVTDNDGTAFKVLQSACNERIEYEMARGLAWVRSFNDGEVTYADVDNAVAELKKTQVGQADESLEGFYPPINT